MLADHAGLAPLDLPEAGLADVRPRDAAVPEAGAGPSDEGAPSSTPGSSKPKYELPLPLDTVLKALWRHDGQHHMARVVDRRSRENPKDPTDYEYYMHYINFNRRLDDWVTADMLDFSFVDFDGVDEKGCVVLEEPKKMDEN